MALTTRRKTLGGVALLIVVVGLLILGLVNNFGPESPPGNGSPPPVVGNSAAPDGPDESRSGSTGEVDPQSGLAWIDAAMLPAEARETLRLIDRGGPYPYDRDGVVFQNREGILPQQRSGYYHEYTVVTPGSNDRGARRIVTGSKGEFYWTADHYASFQRIRR